MADSSPADAARAWAPPTALAAALGVLSSAILGGATGWLAGQTGPDATVVAALLPVTVSAGGVLLVLWRQGRGADNGAWAFMSLCLILFSIALVAGVSAGKRDRDISSEEKADRGFALQLDQELEYLEKCSDWENYVNGYRAVRDLPPLPSDAFCRPR